jgi:hypothetical protein
MSAVLTSGSATSVALTTAEAAILVLGPTVTNNPNVTLTGDFNLTQPATAGTFVYKIRRGSGVTGAVLYTSPPINIAASVTQNFGFTFTDTNAPLVNAQYSVTITDSVTGATVADIQAILAEF